MKIEADFADVDVARIEEVRSDVTHVVDRVNTSTKHRRLQLTDMHGLNFFRDVATRDRAFKLDENR